MKKSGIVQRSLAAMADRWDQRTVYRYVWSNINNMGWTLDVAVGGDSGQTDNSKASSYPRVGTATTATLN